MHPNVHEPPRKTILLIKKRPRTSRIFADRRNAFLVKCDWGESTNSGTSTLNSNAAHVGCSKPNKCYAVILDSFILFLCSFYWPLTSVYILSWCNIVDENVKHTICCSLSPSLPPCPAFYVYDFYFCFYFLMLIRLLFINLYSCSQHVKYMSTMYHGVFVRVFHGIQHHHFNANPWRECKDIVMVDSAFLFRLALFFICNFHIVWTFGMCVCVLSCFVVFLLIASASLSFWSDGKIRIMVLDVSTKQNKRLKNTLPSSQPARVYILFVVI